MGTVLDTTILIDILRGEDAAVLLADRLDESHEPVLIPTPALYEIETGLQFTGSRSEAKRFERSASRFPLASFDEAAALQAAGIRAELLRLGTVKSHPDVMIAGIAAAGNHRLVTRDGNFETIADAMGLDVDILS